MLKLRAAVLIVIASAALLAACDDNGNDDAGTVPETPPAPTGATSATGSTGTTGATGTDGTGVPGDDEVTRIEASITDSDLTISPASVHGNIVLHVMNNSTIDRDVILVQMGPEADSSTMFGQSEDDAVDRASLNIIEEVSVSANSEIEIGTDRISPELHAGNYVILATGADGTGLLWGEFTVTEATP